MLILWLLEELELEFRLQAHARDSDSGLAQTDYKELHVTGQMRRALRGDSELSRFL